MNAGYTKPENEGVKRLSLKDAADVLNISESGVRARFKKGQIEGERDNSGKIWVLVTPAMKDAVQGALKGRNEGSAGVHDRLVDELERQIGELRAERDGYREEARDAARVRVEISRLEAEIIAAQSRVADLRAQLDTSESERRQLFSAVVEQASGSREEVPNHHGGFSIFGFQISRKRVR